MADLTWTWYRGQQGITRRGMLSDGNGRVNLDQFSSLKVLIANRAADETALVAEAVTPDADQDDESTETAGKGWFTYTVSAAAAAIPARKKAYKVSVLGMASGAPIYYPLNINLERTFGSLIVHDPLPNA